LSATLHISLHTLHISLHTLHIYRHTLHFTLRITRSAPAWRRASHRRTPVRKFPATLAQPAINSGHSRRGLPANAHPASPDERPPDLAHHVAQTVQATAPHPCLHWPWKQPSPIAR